MPVSNVGYLFAKGLKKVMSDAFADEQDYLEKVIPDESSDTAYVEWTAMVGPGMAPEKPKGEEFTEQDLIVKTPKRVWHVTYGLQVRVSFEDIDDEQYGKLKNLAKEVGRSLRSRKAMERAMIFNGMFNTWNLTGYDGKALLTTDHTLDRPAYSHATTDLTTRPGQTTYTWSNELATASDLDYVALTDAITLLKKTPNWEGDPIDIEPYWLVAALGNWSNVYEILRSVMRPDTSNNAKSAVNSVGLTGVDTARLIDSDAWFVGTKRHDIHLFDRMGLRTQTNVDPTTWDSLAQGAIRFTTGCFDPRGWVGTPGA